MSLNKCISLAVLRELYRIGTSSAAVPGIDIYTFLRSGIICKAPVWTFSAFLEGYHVQRLETMRAHFTHMKDKVLR